MKKALLLFTTLTALLGTAVESRGQANLVHGIVAGMGLIRMAAHKKPAAQTASPNTSASTYRGQQLVMQRTPTDQLPKKGGEQVTDVETQLNRFHTALLADSTSALCTPEQRTAIQTALVSLARAQPRWNLQAYQQEAAFYLAENTRRERATGTPPSK
ncbi:hypothetical protein IC235_06675 [Hymenobacter sp. BT664]|uniref:Uncharacterized protein n=1 Tax=Hymenobacter montanus TaxID=2771359 RepID=A0A927GIL1_9BACT|nr:hypothetical protein [Hymenobacter montanus]MBD2767573.1 hypothetical protein [Hymenobacter montanus]